LILVNDVASNSGILHRMFKCWESSFIFDGETSTYNGIIRKGRNSDVIPSDSRRIVNEMCELIESNH
jgi:hypothetical protein